MYDLLPRRILSIYCVATPGWWASLRTSRATIHQNNSWWKTENCHERLDWPIFNFHFRSLFSALAFDHIYSLQVREGGNSTVLKLEGNRNDERYTVPGWRANCLWRFYFASNWDLNHLANLTTRFKGSNSSLKDKIAILPGRKKWHPVREAWRTHSFLLRVNHTKSGNHVKDDQTKQRETRKMLLSNGGEPTPAPEVIPANFSRRTSDASSQDDLRPAPWTIHRWSLMRPRKLSSKS